MKCSVCSTEINENYCPNCGQLYKNERISIKSILADLFGNIFSLEKSFFKNLKIGLLEPETLVVNYWNGFRGYYYSPSKFLTIASLFFLVLIMIPYDFLGAVITSKFAQQFTILIFIIILFSILSFINYIKYKKNFYEHLILNIYNTSLWSIIFVLISVLLNILNIDKPYKFFFFYLFILLIIIWDSKPFKMNLLTRVMYIILNCILLLISVYLFHKAGIIRY